MGTSTNLGRRRGRAAALLAAALLLAGATAASAHHGEPATGESEPGDFGEQSGLTDATGVSTDNEGNLPAGGPVAKPGEQAGWQMIAGSEFHAEVAQDPQLLADMAEPAPGEPSPTPYDLDFYGLGFLKAEVAESAGLSHEAAQAAAKTNGFAVGAQCRRSEPTQPVPPDQVAGCDRIPVIYRYHEHPTRGLIWEESYRADDASDAGGFVAAVAWLTPNSALAVGGTGIYPRVGAAEAAGSARAWLYTQDPQTKAGTWRELQNKPDGGEGDEIPDDMGGLTAIDASPRPFDCGASIERECAIAGGLGQLWHYEDGHWHYEDGRFAVSDSTFSARVRDVRFFPNWRLVNGGGNQGARRPERVPQGAAARVRAVASVGRHLDGSGWQPGGGSGGHSLTVLRSRNGNLDSWPGARLGSPPTGCQYDDPRPECDMFRVSSAPSSVPRSTARLVSADGDIRRFCDEGGGRGCDAENLPDTTADWAVGVLRSSGQGVAYNTAYRTNNIFLGSGANIPLSISKPSQCSGDEELIPNSGIGTGSLDNSGSTDRTGNEALCSPEAYQRKNASKSLFVLPSYSLNAYRVAGEDVMDGDEGTGWSVGDHGAILTRGGGVASAEAEPARRGAKSEQAAVPGPGAFDEHRPPATDEPGRVPALAGQPRTESAEPDFYEAQDPRGGGHHVVMSRDGSEGWAFPAFLNGGGGASYDGARWAPCDARGVPDLLPPDPACAELSTVSKVKAIARVPLERDADPSNDDEFEAVALTDRGLYRYRAGRWSRDVEAVYRAGFGPDLSPVNGDDVVFTAPDDGWVVGAGQFISVIHFDGEHWVSCALEPAACGDQDGRLAIQASSCGNRIGSASLTAAGERVYLISIRDVSDPPVASLCNTPWPGTPHPVILYHDHGGTWQGGVDPDWENGVDTTPEDGYNPTDGGWDPGCADMVEDPDPTKARQICQATGDPKDRGKVTSLSVAQEYDGSFQGWATGTFGGAHPSTADAVMMRLSDGRDVPDVPGEDDGGTIRWRPWLNPDAANDYLRFGGAGSDQQLTLPSQAARRNSFLFGSVSMGATQGGRGDMAHPPALAFDQERGRWEAIPTPWSVSPVNPDVEYTGGATEAVAPDGQGGFWAEGSGYFHHYTGQAPEPVFEHTADPAGGAQLTALEAGSDGTVWLGDANGSVYRYDRLAGWTRGVRIPEWDLRRTTRPAEVSAIAVGPEGEGVAVGPGGRIADLGEEIGLDPAATVGCANEPVPPCGTGNDLLAAAVAPDGSAIVAGRNRTLLWRPEGSEFRPIAGPPVPLATEIRKVSTPAPNRAWLLTDKSRVIRGEMSASGAWSWRLEVGSADGKPDPLTAWVTPSGKDDSLSIEDIAVDASGHGYAVGQRGLVLERTGDAEQPWRRLASGYTSDLQQVTLPAGGGEGALIGGKDGLLLTGTEHGFEVARHADPYDPVIASGRIDRRFGGRVAGLALAPGYRSGDVEAWALLRADGFGVRQPPPEALLHHPGAPADPRLDPARRLTALPDAPASRPGEVSFAAFGKQDCDATNRSRQQGSGLFATRDTCGPPDGANVTADLIVRRIGEELTQASREKPAQFAIFTGDAVDKPGGGETVSGGPFPAWSSRYRTPLDVDLKHRRWVELIPNRLEDQGLPSVAALGGQDLSRNLEWCDPIVIHGLFGGCAAPGQAGAEQLGGQAGPNLPWRAAIAFTPAPWESSQQAGGLRFEPVDAIAISAEGPDASTPAARPAAPWDLDPQLEGLGQQIALGGPRGRAEPYPLGSGDTHYATDVYRGSEKVARVVVVDTSMRSIAASDPQQHPHEAGGQLRWLEEMLCIKTVDADPVCTREPSQQAIVVSNTPTYSYGPISPDELQTDAAAFEAVLLKNQVNVVVSGRLGWQGRYWTLAPGVHSPCPGQGYRADSDPPSLTDAEVCGAGAAEGADPSQLEEQLPEDAREATGLASSSAIPFVVSSSAGGHFNTKAERGGFATAEAGFWRGYSIVRLDPSGDTRKTIVEQRPILDWVGLAATDPVVEPRRTLKLESIAREAFGMDTSPRYYPIDFEGITHRYDLLLADPDDPAGACVASDAGCQALHAKLSARVSGLASQHGSAAMQDLTPAGGDENPCEPYLCLPERVGTIDSTTGEVKGGNGKYPDTFALAMLSVGEHVAAQPLVFTRSPSFVVNPLRVAPGAPLATANATGNPNVPNPPQVPQPNIPQSNAPEPPAIPGTPPLAAAQPPEPQPPVPPSPPPPTEQPSPLDLTVSPQSIAIATPTAVIQPPTPPVNPAPPGGARREARQRQAAAQKSGADSEQSEVQELGGDLANRPSSTDGAAMTRYDHAYTRRRPTTTARGSNYGRIAHGNRPASGLEVREPSFTALPHREQPSAWSQSLLYSGGIGLMAFALAAGWSRGRPTPRRRPPEVPAPAWSRVWPRR